MEFGAQNGQVQNERQKQYSKQDSEILMNNKKIMIAAGVAALLALNAKAQTYPPPFNQYSWSTNLTASNTFTPGKIVVLRAGEINDTNFNITNVRQQPAFLEEYDPATTNQTSPILSVALPTNDVNNTLFVNAHAGSEGQGFTRSADRQFLTFTGYTSPMNVPAGTPSSATNADGTGVFNRGIGLLDSYGNYAVVYSSQFWYGIQPGITQNNPRGVCTDGTDSYWGAGTIAGTQSSAGFTETGTLFYNTSVSSDPELVQDIVNSSYYTKIINNVLYMTAKNEAGGASANGIYNFVDTPDNGGAPVPLPWLPGGVQHVVNTNLFLNFGSTYSKVLAFDMNLAGTIAYAADNTKGIVKFTNNGGSWSSAYVFGATNLGTSSQPSGGQGCFGITVDFSGANPVIYATTMEEGDGNNTCSNRLIRIVDTGSPGTNMVAETLVQAGGINEVLRGVAFAPDLTPAITSEPASVTVATGGSASFTVGVQSVTNVTYQWQQNGTNVSPGGTSATLSFSSLTTNSSGNSYVVIVTSAYGSVTSAPPAILTVLPPTLPSYTNTVADVTNYVGDIVHLSVSPGGTPPFTYQWYFGSTMLVDDGVKYSGSTNSSLTISNVQTSDSGNYYVGVTNSVGGIQPQVAALSVIYLAPSIAVGGEPAPLIMLAGQTNSMTVSQVAGTPTLNYQWYQGNASPSTKLLSTGEFSGTGTNTLTISGVSFADQTNYFCVVSNNGGSTVSTAASVTVIATPPLSFIPYSNQVYTQNFDTVPYQPGANINTDSGGGYQPINGVVYSPANPYDFAFPLFTNISGGNSGGLALSNSMPGWYGECDVVQAGAQIGAADGSTTTGGIYSFGATNNSNRALGLISTSSSLGVHFGLKLINNISSNPNYFSLQVPRRVLEERHEAQDDDSRLHDRPRGDQFHAVIGGDHRMRNRTRSRT